MARLRVATQGEYDVLREVGHGGMAAVYLAWDRELARYVAIKVLLPELAHHPTMSQRFLQEARTAANLDDHPSVVRVYRAKEAQGLRYFVMKYVDGCSLDQLLRSSGPLAPDLAAHVVDQVALALQYAHEHGVVHRDVKPGNILLDRAGGVVVTDFGIAKVAEAEQLTRTGFAIGTPHYMSPEQWRVEPLTPASDQYALGVVAYHLVTGEVPFDGTQYGIQEQHLRAEPPALSARRDGVPAAFGAVVRVMLAKAPVERFPDLRSVSQALSAIPRDSPPVLRERLSRLIPAANTPGVREVPPPDVPLPPPQPEVVERRSGLPPVIEAPAPGPVTPRVPAPSFVPPKVTPTMFTPAVAMPIAERVPEPMTPSLGATTFDVVPEAVPDAFPPLASDAASVAASIAPPLDGPITRRDPERRIWPWLAAAVVLAMLVGGGVAIRSRPQREASAAPAPVAPPAAAVGAAAVGSPAVVAGPTPTPAAAPSADSA
ncbi:MAG TPA: serine/threonine-protein kinase, partial [Gemmatirosa sp.]